jgi:hypothetical protein
MVDVSLEISMQCYLASRGDDPLLLGWFSRDSIHDISRQCLKDGEKDREGGITRSGGEWRAQAERVAAASGHPSAFRIHSRRKATISKHSTERLMSCPSDGITKQEKKKRKKEERSLDGAITRLTTG